MFSLKKPVAANGAPTDAKPKFKLRKKHLKKALVITLYAFVALATIIGMIAPTLQF